MEVIAGSHMKLSQSRLFLEFSIVSLGLMLLFALALSWVVGNGLNHEIGLLHAHGAATIEGGVPADAPYSIPNIEHFGHRLISLLFNVVAIGSFVVYAVLLTLVWLRGWRGATASPGPAFEALRRAMLLEFSGLSFGIMLLLGIGLAWLVGYGFSHQLSLLQAHGQLMHGMPGEAPGMEGVLAMRDPYSIVSIERDARSLMLKGFVAVAVASLLVYAALLLLVGRGWRNLRAGELRWSGDL